MKLAGLRDQIEEKQAAKALEEAPENVVEEKQEEEEKGGVSGMFDKAIGGVGAGVEKFGKWIEKHTPFLEKIMKTWASMQERMAKSLGKSLASGGEVGKNFFKGIFSWIEGFTGRYGTIYKVLARRQIEPPVQGSLIVLLERFDSQEQKITLEQFIEKVVAKIKSQPQFSGGVTVQTTIADFEKAADLVLKEEKTPPVPAAPAAQPAPVILQVAQAPAAPAAAPTVQPAAAPAARNAAPAQPAPKPAVAPGQKPEEGGKTTNK